MLNILFAARDERWAEYQDPLTAAFADAGLDVHLARDLPPSDVDYIVYAPNSELQDFQPYTRTKAVMNLWAGVESIVGNTTLTQPLTRMVGGGLTEGMVEWVTGHVLRHHLGMDAHIHNPDCLWPVGPPPLAQDRKVAMLGTGALGAACGQALATLGFNVHGWSRRAKQVPAMTCHHGAHGLADALRDADFVILLLPDTPATQNILNAQTLSLMARGGFVLNPGRGPLIDDTALISALDSGQIAHATLDTFRQEPLPRSDPYWDHPKVTVTPHIASETRAPMAGRVIAENIAGHEAGRPLQHVVDRTAGY